MFLTSLRSKWLFLVAMAILMTPDLAIAMSNGSPIDIQHEFKYVASAFYKKIEWAAVKLLWGLAALEFSWGALKHLIEQQPFEKYVGLLFKVAIAPAVYSLFVHKGADWLPLIVDSFKWIGEKGTDIKGYLNPDGELNPIAIFDMGVSLQNSMVASYNQASGADTMVGALTNILPSLLMMAVCLVILASFAAMALTMFLAMVESYLLMAVAPILFAFGASRWTKDISLKPWNSMIAVGVKITVLYLIMSVTLQLAPIWAKMAASWTVDDWSPLWYIAFSAMGVAILTWRIPKIAADALSGTASLSAGEALQIAAAAMAGAVGATAVGAKLAEKTVDSVTDVLGKASSNIPAFSSVNAISNLTSDSKPSVSVPDPTGPAPDGNAYSGNAKGATISGAGANASEGNVEKMFEKFAAQNQNRNLSDRLQDGLRSFQSAIPNDQATVGGDLVRNHSDG